MGIAIRERESVPVLVGVDEDRAEIAILEKKIKLNLEQKAKDLYSESIAYLQENHMLLAKQSKRYITLPARACIILWGCLMTQNLRRVRLNFNRLSPEQVVVLVHWYLEAAAVFPFMLYARAAQRQIQELIEDFHYRYSEKPCWEQAYYHYLNARALHARQKLLPRFLWTYKYWPILQNIETALRLSEGWTSIRGEPNRRYAAQSCVYRKTHIGLFYIEIARKVKASRGELRHRAQSVLREAVVLAEGYADMGEESQRLRSMLEKIESA